MKRFLMMLGCIALIAPALLLTGCGGDNISKEAQNYNIVFTNATVPLNMAAMDIWTSTDITYFWYGRKDTFADISRLSQRVNLVGNAGKKSMMGLPNGELKKMAKQVGKLYKANKKNTFKLYCVDYGIEAPMKIFYGNNIPEANFEVIFCSDGDGSYNYMREFLNGEDQDKIMEAKVAEVDAMIAKAKKGKYSFGGNAFNYWAHSFAYATKDNVTLWLQRTPAADGGAVDTDGIYNAAGGRFFGIDSAVAAQMNIARKDLYAMAQELQTKGGKYAIDSFKKAMFGLKLEQMFNGIDGKLPLIVTGTSFTGETDFTSVKQANEKSNLETAFNKIKQVYGDEYFFIYKGHPSWPTHEGWDNSVSWKSTSGVTKTDFNTRAAYIANNFDFEIPAQIPADMIMLFYQDDYALNFGGYDSSLFAAADKGSNPGTNHNVLFFIGALGASNQTIYDVGGFNVNGQKPKLLTPETYPTFAK